MTPEQQENVTWGNQFHLLMQQHELGLPLEPTLESQNLESQNLEKQDSLRQCMKTFLQAAPHLFQPQDASKPIAFRQSEHRRSLEFQEFLFTVVYDLVILSEGQAHILDWKTHPRPRSQHWLEQDWQTRLYQFVLAETSPFQPEQICMTYWFVRAIDETSGCLAPKALQFRYNARWHEKNRQDLTLMLTRLSEWLDHYNQGDDLPQVDEAKGHCVTCSYARRCQRNSTTERKVEWQFNRIEDIQEVAP